MPTPTEAVISSDRTLRILLVQDDPDPVAHIRRAFRASGETPELVVVSSIAAANRSIEEEAPDLLVTSAHLPDGNGLDLLRAHPDRPFPAIVLMSGDQQRDAVRAMRAGALDCVIQSPASLDAMPQIVHRALREWSVMEERSRLEEELRAAQRLEAVGRLAGGIAHDFNNLLTIIGTHLELITTEVPDNDAVQESASEIEKAYESAASLTRQMLAFGGKQVLDPVVLDVNDSVRSVSGMLSRVIGEEFELVLDLSGESCPVDVEPASFEQVVINLVVNARDAMPAGGTVLVATETLVVGEPLVCVGGSLPGGAYCRLSVRDRGLGIDADVLERIFDPFFTTKPLGRGTGLGLPSALGIVRQSGGDIQVESEPGVGTVFSVFLPMAQGGAESPTPTGPVESTPLDGHETILVAEDDRSIRSLIHRVLTSRGYEVLQARDGEEAMELLRERGADVDLLLTDVVMPKAGGADVAVWLDEVRPGLRTVLMSGYVDDRLPPERLEAPHTRYIAKPFTGRTLCEVVRELLDREAAPSR